MLCLWLVSFIGLFLATNTLENEKFSRPLWFDKKIVRPHYFHNSAPNWYKQPATYGFRSALVLPRNFGKHNQWRTNPTVEVDNLGYLGQMHNSG